MAGDGGNCFISTVDPQIQLASAIKNFWYISRDAGQTFAPLPTNNNNGSGLFINPADYDAENDILYTYAGNSDPTAFGNRGKIMRIRNVTAIASSGVGQEVDVLRLDPSLDNFYITHIQVYEHSPNTLLIGTAAGPSPSIKPKLFKLVYADTVENMPGNSLLQQGVLIPIHPTSGVTFPDHANISCVAVDPNQSGHLVATMYNFGVFNVFETTNEGISWTRIDNNNSLPDIPVRWAAFNPNNSEQLLLATEVGVWATDSIAGPMTDWHPANKNLANVRIDMLKVRSLDNIIYAATHGRGLFVTEYYQTQKADFTVNTQNPCKDQILHFTNLSIGDSSWAWDFDSDGIIDDTTENPSACVYGTDVTLTINGNIYLSHTKTNYITVNTICTSNDCFTGNGNSRLPQSNDFHLRIYPNPFSDFAKLAFELKKESMVSIDIFDFQGRKVSALLDKKILGKGQQTFSIRRETLGAHGTYFCAIYIDGFRYIQKIILL